MTDTRKSRAVVDYWCKHYSACGFCELCGNSGVIDARSARLAGGASVGRLHWCICPNGQSRRKANSGMCPVDIHGHGTDESANPLPPADDARDAGHNLLRQALAAMQSLRQGLESPDKNDGQYIFNAGAVRAFVDEQARLMFEEKRLTDRAIGGE